MRKKPQEKSFQTTYENVQEWEKALLHNQNTPNHVLVVDVHASWCGKCQSILPVFEKINLEYADEHPLAFGVLDSEKILSELHDLMKPVPRQLGVPSMQLRGSSKNLLVLGDHEVLSDELKKKKLYKEDVKRKNYKATLESCVGLSEPHFLIFKEGELMRKVRGVNTPSLQRFIIQLLTNEGTEKKEEQHENVSEIKTIQIEEPKQEVVIEVKQEETKPTEVNSTETSESAPKEKPSESSKNDTTEEQKQESSKEAHPSEDESMKLSQDEKPQDTQTAETNVEIDSKPTETTSEVTLNAQEERQQMDVNTQETSMNDLSSDRKSIEAVPQETSKNESLQQEQPLEPTEETKTEVKLETPSQEKRQAEEIPTETPQQEQQQESIKMETNEDQHKNEVLMQGEDQVQHNIPQQEQHVNSSTSENKVEPAEKASESHESESTTKENSPIMHSETMSSQESHSTNDEARVAKEHVLQETVVVEEKNEVHVEQKNDEEAPPRPVENIVFEDKQVESVVSAEVIENHGDNPKNNETADSEIN